MREWLTVIIVVVIIGVLLDGIRRMRQAKRNSIKMSLGDTKTLLRDPLETYGSELPNGGARIATRDEIEAEKLNSQLHKVIDPYRHGKRDASLPADEQDEHIIDERISELDFDGDDYAPAPEAVSVYQAEPEPTHEETVETVQAEVDPDSISMKSVLTETRATEVEVAEFESEPGFELNAQLDFGRKEPTIEPASTRKTISVKQSQKKAPKKDKGSFVQQSFLPFEEESFNEESDDDFDDVLSPTRTRHEPITTSKSKSKTEAAEKVEAKAKPTQKTIHQSIEEVFVIHIKSAPDQLYCGNDLLPILQEQGVYFGSMNIFHAHENNDPNEPVIFSIANMVMPGTFTLEAMESFTTPGLSLFLNLPLANTSGLQVFNQMLELAHSVSEALGGEINDEDRNVLTRQTAEHYRERIRDFARKQQIRARA